MSTLHRFTPDPDPVVVPAEEQHIPDARALWMDRFGGDRDVVDGWLEDTLDEDRPEETFVALDGGNVLGMGVATLCEPDYAHDYVGFDVPEFNARDPTGVLHMNAVAEDRTGEGLGTELFKARLQYLRASGARGAFGIAWHREDHPDSRPIFEKFGFDCLGTWDRYYARTHGRDNCPDCGGECSCTASLYASDFRIAGEQQDSISE